MPTNKQLVPKTVSLTTRMNMIPRYFASVVLCGLGAFTGFVALAQPLPVNSLPVQAGTCYDQSINSTLLVREVTTTYPNGFTQKFAHLLPLPHPIYGPQPVPIPAVPDPSGIHLLAIRSGVAGNQFWIQRDGQLIRIDPSGNITPIGSCSLHPAFVAQFPGPVVKLPTQFKPVAAGFDGAAVQTTTPVSVANIPDGTLAEGVYTIPPVMVPSKAAKECVDKTAQGDSKGFFRCIIAASLPEKQKAIFDCASKGGSSKEKIVLCLMASGLDNNQKAQVAQVQTCYAKHGANWNAYPVCLASANADPTIAHALSCMKQNATQGKQPDLASLAVCVAGPSLLGTLNPNAESQVAIDCAMKSGGDPEAFVVCTGGTLLGNELQKCVTNGFGGSGCFGTGNTLTKVYDEIDNGIRQAFGDNSIAFKAWQLARLNQDPSKMIEAVNNISTELDTAGNNIKTEVQKGLDKAAPALAKIVPQVTVGKPNMSGRVFGKKFKL